ncbi:MAG: hypothetical protein ABIN97_13485, partial [Ginsengibacter sp.]
MQTLLNKTNLLLTAIIICFTNIAAAQIPGNDECALAVMLGPSADANFAGTPGTTTGATAGPTTDCYNETGVDVWFKFE